MADKFEPKHHFKGEHESREGKWEAPYDKPGPQKGEAYGIAAVTQVLQGMEFPAKKQDILDKVRGNEEVHWTKDKAVNLRVIFNRVEQEEFGSMSDVVHVVSEEAHKEGGLPMKDKPASQAANPPGEKWEAPYEKPGPEKGEAYGMGAVTQVLQGLDFPASKRDVLNHIKGNERIHWSKDKTINLRDVLERLDKQEFTSMADVTHSVSHEALGHEER